MKEIPRWGEPFTLTARVPAGDNAHEGTLGGRVGSRPAWGRRRRGFSEWFADSSTSLSCRIRPRYLRADSVRPRRCSRPYLRTPPPNRTLERAVGTPHLDGVTCIVQS